MQTIGKLLRTQGSRHPSKIFLQTPAGDVTFAELDGAADRMAASFRACGIEPGDRIAIAAPNIAEWLYTFFGAVRMGATLVTLDVRYREKELEAILNESSARLLVTSATSGDFDFTQFYPTFRPRIPTVEEIFYIGGNFTQLLEASPLEHEAHIDPHTPAVMMYAADTTGQLKSVTLTHASLLASASAQEMPMREGDITFGVLRALIDASKVEWPAAAV